MKKYLLIILIIIFAAVLRFYAVSDFPSGLNADEAALGYNAYSLLNTGKDEDGHLLPVNLESFGDYKPALYSYLLVPVVKFLGLNEFAVRLPSALFGVLSVFLIFVFVLLITYNYKLSAVSSVLLAISPWHLHFSRGAWEVNVSTALILLGVIFFLKWRKTPTFINFTFFLLNLILSMYTYQSARVISPLLLFGLLIISYKYVFSHAKTCMAALPLMFLISLPLLFSVFNKDTASRLSGVGLLADMGPLNLVNELRGQYHGPGAVLEKMLFNRPVFYTIQFIKNYLSHFDGNFLFIGGDAIQRNRVPETGLLYWTDFVFLLFGLFYLLKIKNSKLKIVWLWLLVAPVAAAMTFQVPHALRAQNMVIPLTIITAAGLSYFLGLFSDWKLSVICILVLGIYTYQFTRYLHEYYVHYPQTYPSAWEYGFKEMVAYVARNQDRYHRILVTDKYDQPYILFLFYLKYPPQKFQGHHELTLRDRYNFSTVKQFDKYRFTDTNWNLVRDIHGTLIVAAPEDIPSVGVNIVKTIYFPGGSPAFKIISN